MSIRIAIVGASPCDRCVAACCKQNGHDYAALLRGDEVRKFAAYSTRVSIRDGERVVVEHALPYADGRCQFLGQDDRCTIYEDRPNACRAFQCIEHFNVRGHGVFLQRNPKVREMLDVLSSEPSSVGCHRQS